MESYIIVGNVIFLSLIVFIGLLTNSIILFLIYLRSSLRTPFNMYFGNKVFSDFLLLLTSPIHLISMMNRSGWPFGTLGCQIVSTLDVYLLLVSLHSLYALGHLIYAIFVKPKWEVDNMKAFNHMVANWIYCSLIALPIPTVAYAFYWEGNTVCGYRWPPMQNYYAMFFISLCIVGFLGPFGFFAWWIRQIRTRISEAGPDDALDDKDTKDKYRSWITLCIVALIRWLPYWGYHFTTMGILGDNHALSFHVPGGEEPFSIVVTWAVYIVAASNMFVLVATMDKWRLAVKDVFHLTFRDVPSEEPENAIHVSVISVQPAEENNLYDNTGMIEMEAL